MNFALYLVPMTVMGFGLALMRKSPFQVCILVLAYAFGEAAFIRTWEFTFRVPFFPFPLNKDDLMLLLLLGAWLYVRQKRPSCQRLWMRLDLALAGLLIGLLIVQLPLGWIAVGDVRIGAIFAGRAYFYLPLSFILWIDILRRGTRDEAKDLVTALSLLTVPLMGLYALSAVGVQVYPERAYQTMFMGSATVVRDFLTFPYWTKLAIAYCLLQLAKGKADVRSLGALGILMAGTVLSLTRSYMFPLAAIVLLALLYSMIRLRGSRRLWTVIATVVAGGVVVLLLGRFAPENLRIFGERIAQLRTSSLQDTSLGQRFRVFEAINGFVGRVDPFFGIGFTGLGERSAALAPVTYWGDMMWFSILAFLGWFGIVILGALLALSLWNCLRIMTSQDAAAAQMGLLLTMVMTWDVSRTFVGEGYLWLPAAGTFVLALVAVETRALWAAEPVTIERMPFLRGVTLNWFTRDDRYAAWRRLALAAVVASLAIRLGTSIAR